MTTTAQSKTRQARRAERERILAEAVHSTRMEGLEPTAQFHADAQEAVDGTITADELVARTRARYGLTD